MIPLLAAAVLLLMLAGGKSRSSSEPATPTTVDTSADPSKEVARIMSLPSFAAELTKLKGADATLYGWVTTLLSPAMTNNPVYIAGYAAAAQAGGYPTIAQALGARFLVAVHKTVGKSGQEWYTWTGSATPDSDGNIAIDVLYGATPVLSYKEKLGGGGGTADPAGFKSTRKLIGVALDPSKYTNAADMQKILDNAKMDFGPAPGVALS